MRRAALILVLVACGSTPPPAAPPPGSGTPVDPVVAKPPPLTGIWLGTLTSGPVSLRVQFHLDVAASPPSCTLDSLDQGAMGTPCTDVVATPTELSLEVPAVHGGFKGTVSADANTVTGTLAQGTLVLPLVLTRQAVALEAAKVNLDPAMPAVELDKLQGVLDDDLKRALTARLAPETGVGVAIGVLSHGARKVIVYGAVKPDSVFEIGSITKTFTGLALAQLVEQKKVRLDEPVRALLPKGTAVAPASGAEITLLDLSAQRSGLPRLPDNMKLSDLTNPYAPYDAKLLYAFVSSHGVALPEKPEFGYSNLGVGLLGQALADRAGSTYEALIKREILTPLAMRDTTIVLTAAQKKRFVPGHTAKNAPMGGWDFNALAGAGALRSTAADMLVYLDAQLHPEHVTGKTIEAKTLGAALVASHELHGEAGGGMHIALNWFHVDASGRYWHNGATGGFSSFAVFDPANDFAVVVLLNQSIEDGTLADDLAKHVVQRLTGAPATSL